MKNTTKISLMSGLMFAGMALGGIHIANAQNNVDHEIDNSRYTVVIPSEVNIDKNTGQGSFAVTGKLDAQTELDVAVTSQNSYKLKCGNKSIDYTLDKQSFHVDNIKSSDVKSFNENFNAVMNHTDMNFSGSYIDKLTFNIVSNVYTYELDLNSVLDDVNNYSVHDYGTADIYINGEKVADDVSDWGGTVHYGDIYEINDIKGTTGHHYSGIADGWNNMKGFPLKGKIGIDTKHVENSKGILYSSIFLKFDTNTYTVKYDSNGGNGSMADTVHKYYKSDKMDGVIKLRKNTFTKTGYKFQGWYLTRVINKEIYYLYDNWQWYKEGVQPSGTKKCLYEDERRTSNATTVDKDVLTAVAQWSPNTYTLTYILDGGSFNASTTQLFKYGSGDAISSEIPNKAGYDFVGWKWGDVTMQPGDTIPKGWGDFTLTAQWEKKSYSAGDTLDIEGAKYVVLEQKENNQALVMTVDSIGDRAFQSKFDWGSGLRPNGQNASTYEDSEIDNYLENDWYNSLSSTMKVAIQSTSIKQASYATSNDPDSKQETGYNGQVYNTIDRHAFLPSVSEIGKAVDLKNPDKVKAFLVPIHSGEREDDTYIWTRDSSRDYANGAMYLESYWGGLDHSPVGMMYGVRPTFVIDLSKVDYTVTGSVNYK